MTESNIGDAAVGPGTENVPSSPHLFLTILPEQQDSVAVMAVAPLSSLSPSQTWAVVLVDIIVLAAILFLLTSHEKAALFRASGRKVQLIIRTSGTPSVLYRAQTAWMDMMAATLIDVKKYIYTEIYTSKEQSEFAA